MPCLDETPRAAIERSTTIDLPEGVPPLSTIYLYASGGCNLACRHCWISPAYDPGRESDEFISLDYVRTAIREGTPLGLSAIKLTGGEPTLHPQFRELVELIGAAGIGMTMETNGVLVDGDLARFLRDTGRVRHVSVSLDGATPEVHDSLRGVPQSWARAVAGIEHLAKAGFRPQMICTLHAGNCEQIRDVVALAQRLGCGSVKFNHIQSVGRGECVTDEERLDVPSIIELYRQIEEEIAPGSPIPLELDIPLAFRPIHRLLSSPLYRCNILNILGMLSSGDLALCGIGATVPELVFGHVAREGVRNVWVHSPTLIRLRKEIPVALEGVCGNCLHRDSCLGHCIAQNYHLDKRLSAEYWFCATSTYYGVFPLSRLIPSKGQPGEPIEGEEHDNKTYPASV